MPPFGNRSCSSTARLSGKTTLITGCNSGIGKETAQDFYKRGAKVIMACRSMEKAESAKLDIEESCKDLLNVGSIVIVKCDLLSLKSVRECAQYILDTEPQLNILVNNAGVMMCPKGETEDGFETQLGTNHLAHFLLTMLLLPRIRSSTPARIVTVASKAHQVFNINFEDLNYKTRPFRTMEAYSQSKLSNVLFSQELASKLKENNIEGITTYSLHPGVIMTDLGRHLNDTVFKGSWKLFGLIFRPFTKTVQQGAQTSIYCAIDEKCAHETGLYYDNCAVASPARSVKEKSAKKLWDISVELVKLGEYNPFTAPDPGVKTLQP